MDTSEELKLGKENSDIHEIKKQKARENHLKRKAQGKVKSIHELSEAEKQKRRKQWRQRQIRYRNKKKNLQQDATASTKSQSPLNTEHRPLLINGGVILDSGFIPCMDNNSESAKDAVPRAPVIDVHEQSTLEPVRKSSRERKPKTLDYNFLHGVDAQRKKRTPRKDIAKNTVPIYIESLPKPNYGESRQKQLGRKIKHRHTSRLFRNLQKTREELMKKTKEANKYKKRYERLKLQGQKKNESVKQMKKIVGKRIIPKDVQSVLVEHLALKNDLNESFKGMKSRKDKAKLSATLKFDRLRACKLYEKGTEFLPSDQKRKVKRNSKARKDGQRSIKQKLILDFWHSEIASTICPGKKQSITIKKIKHQLRYMNGSRKRLYKLFMRRVVDRKISYAAFCKLKPLWIVRAKVSQRDTCMCTTHENMKLKVQALHKYDILDEKDAEKLVDNICCESGKIECLLRRCNVCKDKRLEFKEYSKEQTVDFQVWMSVQEKRVSARTKKDIIVKRTVLQSVTQNASVLVDLVSKDIFFYAKHIGRHYHQYQVLAKRIENLTDKDLLLRIDFSENYNCKYSKEVQGVHFGASRNQVTIHTGMMYTKGAHQAFATVSPDLSHDALAVMVHLKPIIHKFLEQHPQVNNLIIFSDSPSTQYRNKTIFGLLPQHFAKEYTQLSQISWNYSEAGHGKSPADGVGAVLKRTADGIVASNEDIDTFAKFVTALQNKENVQNILILSVTEEDIGRFKESYKGKDISFKGAMKVHQVKWSKANENTLLFCEHSCFECEDKVCEHYHLGSEELKPQSSSKRSGKESSEIALKKPLKKAKTTKRPSAEKTTEGVTERPRGNTSEASPQPVKKATRSTENTTTEGAPKRSKKSSSKASPQPVHAMPSTQKRSTENTRTERATRRSRRTTSEAAPQQVKKPPRPIQKRSLETEDKSHTAAKRGKTTEALPKRTSKRTKGLH